MNRLDILIDVFGTYFALKMVYEMVKSTIVIIKEGWYEL
jgi:hypothetical protein